MKSINRSQSPPHRGGVDATSSECCQRHPCYRSGRGGQNWTDHPVCASTVASQLFLIAQPPLLYEEGTSRMPSGYISLPPKTRTSIQTESVARACASNQCARR